MRAGAEGLAVFLTGLALWRTSLLVRPRGKRRPAIKPATWTGDVMPEIGTHPTAQQLALFGHGKLSEGQAATVAAHLETCADCWQAVADLPPDSFLDKVREARTSAAVPPSGGPAADALRG